MLSERAAEHVHTPRNAGRIPSATHVGVGGTPGEGPYSLISLVVMGGVVERAGYECNGCPSSIAASSMVAQIVAGRTVEQALLLCPEDVCLLLGGLPEGKGYYAELAVAALRDALEPKTADRNL